MNAPLAVRRTAWYVGGVSATSGKFTLRTLGRLGLTDAEHREETSLATRPRKLALLAWLSLRPERRATRESTIGVFWGDRDEARARNSLSDAISHLRRVLGRDALRTQGSEIVLADDAPLVVDALELIGAASRGDHARVAELYRGPFLDGFYINDAPEFDEWRDRERARLARRFSKSAAAHCAKLAEAADWETCRDVAERWLDVEAESKDAGLMLLRATAAPSTHAAYATALRSYESLVARLDRELGIAPAPDVQAFANDITDRLSKMPSPAAAVPSVPVAAEPPPPPSARRTGRTWHRPALVVGACLLVAVIGLTTRRAPPLDHRRVIVAAFQNQTGDSSLSPLGAVAADWVSRGLTETRTVEVADPLLSIRPGASSDPRAIGRSAQAGIVVLGSYVRQGDSIAMDARLVDANTGRVLRTTPPAMAPLTRPLLAVNAMRQRIAGAMAAEVDPVIARLAREASQPPTYDAYLAWIEGLDLFSRRDYRGSIAPFLRAAALDSSFVSPKIWAMAAYGNTGDYPRADSILRTVWPVRARLAPLDRGLVGVWYGDIHGDRMAEYSAAREMLAAAPGSELSLFIAGLAAIYANRPGEAVPLLRRIPAESSAVLWDVYGTRLAQALHMAGRHDEEIRETARRLARQPASLRALDEHGQALAAVGRAREAVDVAIRILESGRDPSLSRGGAAFDVGVELIVHDHPAEAREVFHRIVEWRLALPPEQANTRIAQTVLAAALYRSGNLEAADSVLRAELGASPSDATFLRWYGLVAATRGDTAQARRAMTALAGLNTPYDRGVNALNRAEIAAALGDSAEATRLVRQAMMEGITPVSVHLRSTFSLLRSYAPFAAVVKPAG